MLKQIALIFSLCFCLAAGAAESLLWVEGEKPTASKDIVANTGFNNINPYALSGGAWLSSFSEPDMPSTGTAEYAVDNPIDGKYNFWLRAVTGTGLAYRCDAGDWVYVDAKKGIDTCAVAPNGNWGWPPSICWYNLGALSLTAGKHTIGFLLGGTKEKTARYAALDCFVLTTGDFKPNGKYKPGDKDATQTACDIPVGKGWDFIPVPDKLDPTAMLDLRYLNEKVAGEHGFIRQSADGNSFVRSDGQPIRFWAMDDSVDLKLDALKRHAQFLAKRGVNMVRVGPGLQPKNEGSNITDVDERSLDTVFKEVAAMKTAGIYTIISPYWGNACTVRKSWGTMADGGQSGSDLLFFETTMQKGYRAWLKALYTRPNPYTGIKLADDPAVAFIQLQNENSLLWWDTLNFKGEVLRYFRTLYHDFLVQKYGSLEKARAAWQDYNPIAKDTWVVNEWDKGLPGLVNPWDFTRDGIALKGKAPGFRQCTADQVEFLCRTMRKFNEETVAYLKNDLGCKQLVNGGNWHGPDGLTQDAEYWANAACGVIGRNIYTGGYHIGINDGWQVLNNGYFTNVSVLKQPISLPINVKHPLGHPFIISETAWVHPNLYQSEGPLMVAAQSCLTGFNTAFWFCSDAAEWTDNAATKWSGNFPMQLGQLPAAALIFRQGLVKEGAPAVIEQRSLQNIWDHTTPLITDENGWDDPNHSAGNMKPNGTAQSIVDQLAYFVGPVQVIYGGDPGESKVINLNKYIDRKKMILHSDTGQIVTDYGKGIYRVNAPCVQAAAGFLGSAGPQQLADVSITCKNNYAAITVVSLDGKPIKQSGKLLVQVGTVNRPTDWTTQPYTLMLGGKPTAAIKIVSIGKMPWQVEKTDAVITVANGALTTATALDLNGMPSNTPVKLTRIHDKAMVVLPPDSMYLVLTGGAGQVHGH